VKKISKEIIDLDQRNYEYSALRVSPGHSLVTSLLDRLAWKGNQLIIEKNLVLGLTQALGSVLSKGSLSKTWSSGLDKRFVPGMVLEEFLFQARISQAISLSDLRRYVQKVEHAT
jgi:hypothetical protein